MRALSSVAVSIVLATAAATAARADETTGTILAFDRAADVIVMEDKSIWQLQPTTLIPADLAAGDRITITFTSAGDSGVGKVLSLEKQQ